MKLLPLVLVAGLHHCTVVRGAETGGNADHDQKDAPLVNLTRDTRITGGFLQLPLMRWPGGTKAGLEKLTIESDGRLLRYMHVDLPEAGEQPDFRYSVDLREFRDRDVTLRYQSSDPGALQKLGDNWE